MKETLLIQFSHLIWVWALLSGIETPYERGVYFFVLYAYANHDMHSQLSLHNHTPLLFTITWNQKFYLFWNVSLKDLEYLTCLSSLFGFKFLLYIYLVLNLYSLPLFLFQVTDLFFLTVKKVIKLFSPDYSFLEAQFKCHFWCKNFLIIS